MTRGNRQDKVEKLVRDVFGDNTFTIHERISRFIEEAIELAQAEDFPKEDIERILNHVYTKVKGKPITEAGDVGITLLAYCACAGFSAEMAEIQRFDYIHSLSPNYFRERHNLKVDKGIAVRTDK